MPLCPKSASFAYLMSWKRAIMFHHATHRCFLWARDAMCAWQGCQSLHFNTKHFVLVLITRQAKADGPCFFLPSVGDSYWQSALSSHNTPEAEESTTSNINTAGRGASNGPDFTLTTVTMFNKLVPESPGVYTPWNERDWLSFEWQLGSFRFGALFSLPWLWMGMADDTHSKMPVWLPEGQIVFANGCFLAFVSCSRFTAKQIGNFWLRQSIIENYTQVYFVNSLTICLFCFIACVCVLVFLKPRSKIQQDRSIYIQRCQCLSLLSDSQSCVKMVGGVSACERPLAISLLLWLSRVCSRHLVTAASKEAARHSLHIKDTSSVSVPVKLYANSCICPCIMSL